MNALTENILISIVSGLAVLSLTQILLFLTRPLFDFLKARGDFTVAGTWVGACVLRGYGEDSPAIEIYYLKVRRSILRFTFFSYRQNLTHVRKHTGGGTRRDSMLAAYYTFPQSDSRETGVILLRARGRGDVLRGMYAQYDLGADEQLTVSGEDFELRRVRLPLFTHIRMAFGRQPVKNYAAALVLLQRAGLEVHAPTILVGTTSNTARNR